MTTNSQLFFVVSSGRSGTAMLHKALSALPNVDMHHEYMVHHIQPLAVRRYLGLANADETRTLLSQTYGAAAHYCEKPFWGDSSNKLSWLIPDLAALFPEAKFVHLVRDGRKVAGSFFHKLGDECYDDRSAQILRAHLEEDAPAPPPEKKYWWPWPPPQDPAAKAFRAYSQFERIAWHWSEINRVILQDLAPVSDSRKHFVRLEDLRADRALLEGLYAFLGLPFSEEAFALFQRPHNVNRPEDKPLDETQRRQFEAIGGAMMARLGYAARPEYVVNY
jgi:hypothetical protein